MHILKSGVTYFALVFGAGFLLGSIRVPFLVPRLGVRTSELLEAPLMLAAVILGARFILHRFDLPTAASRLAAGGLALGLMLLAELGVAFTLQGRSMATLFRGRDPISGSVYLVSLLLFALMPFLLGLGRRARPQ